MEFHDNICLSNVLYRWFTIKAQGNCIIQKSSEQMRILSKRIGKWKEGHVTLLPTDDEDMWHVYNLIRPGDIMRMKSARKITHTNQKTGLRKTRVKRLLLTLVIKDIEYFAQADRLCIRVKGQNVKQHEELKIGQYHTFEIELNNKITIIKDSWSPFEMNLLKELSEITHDVENAAIIMDEGVAHLCYIKPSVTLLRHKVDKNVAKKSCGEHIYKKSLDKFLVQCYSLYKMVDFKTIKCLIIASPGFLNEQFYKYLGEVTQNETDKDLRKNLEKVVLVKSSTGYMNSLAEILSDPKVMSKMENTKAIEQNKRLDKFFEVMKKNEDMVAYGEKDVFHCIHIKAVDTLLISDHLFRTKDFKKRRLYNDIVEEVKKFGGKTVVFSSLHPSGEKLKNISGIAAILRFEVPSLEEGDEEELEVPNRMVENPSYESEVNPNIDLDKMDLGEESEENSYDEDDDS